MTAREHAEKAARYASPPTGIDAKYDAAQAHALTAIALALTERTLLPAGQHKHPHAREEQAYRDLYASHAEKRRREAHKAYGGTA